MRRHIVAESYRDPETCSATLFAPARSRLAAGGIPPPWFLPSLIDHPGSVRTMTQRGSIPSGQDQRNAEDDQDEIGDRYVIEVIHRDIPTAFIVSAGTTAPSTAKPAQRCPRLNP